MEINQGYILEQKRKRTMRDFWFLTAIIVSNFLLYVLRALIENAKSGYFAGFRIVIGAFWFPALFAITSIYTIARFYNFAARKIKPTIIGFICGILMMLVAIISLFLMIMIMGTGHGGPLDFFYEKHLISMIVVALLLMMPYAFVIFNVVRLKTQSQ